MAKKETCKRSLF